MGKMLGYEGVAKLLTAHLDEWLPHMLARIRVEYAADLAELPDPAAVYPTDPGEVATGYYPYVYVDPIGWEGKITNKEDAPDGSYRRTVKIMTVNAEAVVMAGGKGDTTKLAQRYLLAIEGALMQDPKLGDPSAWQGAIIMPERFRSSISERGQDRENGSYMQGVELNFAVQVYEQFDTRERWEGVQPVAGPITHTVRQFGDAGYSTQQLGD